MREGYNGSTVITNGFKATFFNQMMFISEFFGDANFGLTLFTVHIYSMIFLILG